ncbi:response regulator [Pedobacter sp. N23S346]|uniref:response regulator n=1 Tax=Pedobacter sp. N23S346 TaxID=3402750 RepID=UPI003ACE156A
MSQKITKIGIIEDNEYLLRNYNDYFDLQEEYQVSFAFKSFGIFEKSNKDSSFNADIILLDINLPDISGIDAIPILKKYYPKVIIVMLTAYKDVEYIIKSVQSGALGYLVKGMPLNEIKLSLDTYKSGGVATSPLAIKKIFEYIGQLHKKKEKEFETLTPREKQVAECLIEGLSYKGAAIKLGLKPTTINQHLKNIYIKFNVNSKAALISKVLSNQI